MRIRAATRGSALALWQTRHVASLLAPAGIEVDEVVVSTSGDRRQDIPIHEMGGKGVFVKEVQAAVLDGRADIAVHSMKDLPSGAPEGLVLGAVPARADARDALIGTRFEDLAHGATVGSGSIRRRAQLAALRPDLRFEELRGNIATRLDKAHAFDAIVMAAAALERLGEQPEIVHLLPVETMLPQVGQGALAIECRFDDDDVRAALAGIEDTETRILTDAERAFLAELGGDCDLPAGAHAVRDGVEIRLRSLLAAPDGSTVLRDDRRGADADADALGRGAARQLLDNGGLALLGRTDDAG